jgi:type II secretory pathway component PulM
MIWWRERNVSEKSLLATAGALLVLVLIWFAAVRPLMDARATAEGRLRTAATALAEARADVAALKANAGGSGAQVAPRPLAPFISQSATEQGFTNMNITGDQPDRVSIVTAQVRPANFFGWIGQLEAGGVVIESMNASANSDQTIAVQAVLRAGGG